MKAVVLLLTKKDAGDSKEFVFPNLTRVNVTVEGNLNDIYSEGFAKRDMYCEAVRFFTNTECEKYLGTNSVSSVSGSGRKLVGTQAGILLEIEKETTTTDVSCHVFVIADSLINILRTSLNRTAEY